VGTVIFCGVATFAMVLHKLAGTRLVVADMPFMAFVIAFCGAFVAYGIFLLKQATRKKTIEIAVVGEFVKGIIPSYH